MSSGDARGCKGSRCWEMRRNAPLLLMNVQASEGREEEAEEGKRTAHAGRAERQASLRLWDKRKSILARPQVSSTCSGSSTSDIQGRTLEPEAPRGPRWASRLCRARNVGFHHFCLWYHSTVCYYTCCSIRGYPASIISSAVCHATPATALPASPIAHLHRPHRDVPACRSKAGVGEHRWWHSGAAAVS